LFALKGGSLSERHFGYCRGDPGCSCEAKRYWIVFGLAVVIFFAELLGGFYSGSLALISDAFHVFTDGLAMLVSIMVATLVRRRGSETDQRKIRIWGGYFNAVALGVVSVEIFREAFFRIIAPREVLTSTMIVVAIAGMVGNLMQHNVLMLGSVEHNHITHKSLSIHILSDLCQSAAVITAGILIWITGYTIIDPLLSIVVAGWMMVQTKKLLVASYKESLRKVN